MRSDVAAKAEIEIEIRNPAGCNYAILPMLLCGLLRNSRGRQRLFPDYCPPVTAITRRYIIRLPFADDRRRRTERMHVQAVIAHDDHVYSPL